MTRPYSRSRGYCATCRTGAGRDHASTARHRRATAPRSTPGGSHAYSGRRAMAAAGYRAVRLEATEQYADREADWRDLGSPTDADGIPVDPTYPPVGRRADWGDA